MCYEELTRTKMGPVLHIPEVPIPKNLKHISASRTLPIPACDNIRQKPERRSRSCLGYLKGEPYEFGRTSGRMFPFLTRLSLTKSRFPGSRHIVPLLYCCAFPQPNDASVVQGRHSCTLFRFLLTIGLCVNLLLYTHIQVQLNAGLIDAPHFMFGPGPYLITGVVQTFDCDAPDSSKSSPSSLVLQPAPGTCHPSRHSYISPEGTEVTAKHAVGR
ncbi:hypothetical protein EI94DRAFT_828969 [Lactarius quietus]|nr:hypothetical protein EI94DRAFT_828969 [Lactarius quietus]